MVAEKKVIRKCPGTASGHGGREGTLAGLQKGLSDVSFNRRGKVDVGLVPAVDNLPVRKEPRALAYRSPSSLRLRPRHLLSGSCRAFGGVHCAACSSFAAPLPPFLPASALPENVGRASIRRPRASRLPSRGRDGPRTEIDVAGRGSGVPGCCCERAVAHDVSLILFLSQSLASVRTSDATWSQTDFGFRSPRVPLLQCISIAKLFCPFQC